MRLIKVEQGSQEWHDLRRTHMGASSCAAVIGHDPFRSSVDVYEEMVIGKKPFVNVAMRRGMILEPRARDYFNAQFKSDFQPAVGISKQFPWLMASFDGIAELNGKKVVLEIKCPGEKVFSQVILGDIPVSWVWQVQQELVVSTYESAILFVYFEATESTQCRIIEIARDEAIIAEIVEKTKYFYDTHILQWKAPEVQEKDYEDRLDDEWKEAATAFLETKKAMEDLKELENIQRESLIYLSNGRSCKGAGIRLTKSFPKGAVDYTKIPELKGVNLEPYRKTQSEKWTITQTK